MDKEIISLDLKNKLEELQHLINQLSDARDNLSAIDKDLALQKTREIYDLLLNLKSSTPEKTQSPSPKKKVQAFSSVRVEAEIQESETDTSEIDTAEILPADQQEEADLIEKKPPDQKHDPDLFSSETMAPKKNKEPADDKEAIGDIFSESKEQETVAEKIHKDKIKTLNVAIGINDKFYFINELFNGSLNDYSAAIENLDAAAAFNDALAQLDELRSKYNWNKEAEAYLQLLCFIERKFD